MPQGDGPTALGGCDVVLLCSSLRAMLLNVQNPGHKVEQRFDRRNSVDRLLVSSSCWSREMPSLTGGPFLVWRAPATPSHLHKQAPESSIPACRP